MRLLDVTGIVIFRLTNGKIVERWASIDQFAALQQLGVLPPPGAASV